MSAIRHETHTKPTRARLEGTRREDNKSRQRLPSLDRPGNREKQSLVSSTVQGHECLQVATERVSVIRRGNRNICGVNTKKKVSVARFVVRDKCVSKNDTVTRQTNFQRATGQYKVSCAQGSVKMKPGVQYMETKLRTENEMSNAEIKLTSNSPKFSALKSHEMYYKPCITSSRSAAKSDKMIANSHAMKREFVNPNSLQEACTKPRVNSRRINSVKQRVNFILEQETACLSTTTLTTETKEKFSQKTAQNNVDINNKNSYGTEYNVQLVHSNYAKLKKCDMKKEHMINFNSTVNNDTIMMSENERTCPEFHHQHLPDERQANHSVLLCKYNEAKNSFLNVCVSSIKSHFSARSKISKRKIPHNGSTLGSRDLRKNAEGELREPLTGDSFSSYILPKIKLKRKIKCIKDINIRDLCERSKISMKSDEQKKKSPRDVKLEELRMFVRDVMKATSADIKSRADKRHLRQTTLRTPTRVDLPVEVVGETSEGVGGKLAEDWGVQTPRDGPRDRYEY